MSNLHPTMQVAIAPYFNLFAYRAAQVPMAIGWVPQHPVTKPKPADMALLDAVARLMPGVLGDQDSHLQDSFNPALDGLLDSPHHTRPEVWNGPLGPMPVPEVLQGGHHERITRYRREQSLAQTERLRPELLEQARKAGRLSKTDEAFLHQPKRL